MKLFQLLITYLHLLDVLLVNLWRHHEYIDGVRGHLFNVQIPQTRTEMTYLDWFINDHGFN